MATEAQAGSDVASGAGLTLRDVRAALPRWVWWLAVAAGLFPFVVTWRSEGHIFSDYYWTFAAAALNAILVLVVGAFLTLARAYPSMRRWFLLAALVPFLFPAAMTASDLYAVWSYQKWLDQIAGLPISHPPSSTIVMVGRLPDYWYPEITEGLLAEGYDLTVLARPVGDFATLRRIACDGKSYEGLVRSDICYTRTPAKPGESWPAVEWWVAIDGSRFSRGADARAYSLTVHPANSSISVEQGRYDRFMPYVTVPLPLLALQAPTVYRPRTYGAAVLHDAAPLLGWWRVTLFAAGSAGTPAAFIRKVLPKE
jgi:hypothetical protein